MGASIVLSCESYYHLHPELAELYYGNLMGAQLRVHLLRLEGDTGSTDASPPSLLSAVGLGFASSRVPRRSDEARRFRGPTVFGVLAPELGLALRTNHRGSLYTRWSAPAAWLLTRTLALDLDPALALLYDTPSGHPDLLLQVGIGLSVRKLPR